MAVAIANKRADSQASSSQSWTFNFTFTADAANTLLVMVTRDGSTGMETPAGWDSVLADNASSSHTAIYILDPAIGNTAISSVTIDSSSVSAHWAGNVYELSGSLPAGIINAFDFTAYMNDEAAQPVPVITTTLDNCLLITGVGTNSGPVVALDGAVTPELTVAIGACGHTSGSLALGTAGQVQALTHTVGNDGVCYAIAVAPADSVPQGTVHTLKLDKESESTNFALGVTARKNTTEVATSLVAISTLPTDSPQYTVTYASGAPVDGVDSVHIDYEDTVGDIKDTADGFPLESFTIENGTTC